jgi:hypothetical protein
MDKLNHNYFAELLMEQDIKKSVFDTQLQLELLDLAETTVQKQHRLEYMKFLAGRIIEIERLLDSWANNIDLQQKWFADEIQRTVYVRFLSLNQTSSGTALKFSIILTSSIAFADVITSSRLAGFKKRCSTITSICLSRWS